VEGNGNRLEDGEVAEAEAEHTEVVALMNNKIRNV
jgi:hypothetical protein